MVYATIILYLVLKMRTGDEAPASRMISRGFGCRELDAYSILLNIEPSMSFRNKVIRRRELGIILLR